MSLAVGVYRLRGNGRSQRIAEAMAAGIRVAGDRAIVRDDGQYRGPREPVAVFYGFEHNLPRVMKEYRKAGKKAVYIDLGYWGRHAGGRFFGYHKFAINDRHPTAYFQDRPRDAARVMQFGLRARPWRPAGRHILLAGMSDRAAMSIGMQPEEWELWAIGELKKHTKRQIIYRPKPSWKTARRLPGAGFSHQNEPLSNALSGAHAVVTHHSNVAIDALMDGIPAFVWDGVAKPMSLQDLSRIESPIQPDGREQWVRDISYCQYNVREMIDGTAWRQLKADGLVP